MRKMKKINGYLVVRFNDREKRERPELGNFGVIDAELYSGNLLVDLDAMEYTDADLIEAAVEQARGLNSEFDMEEPEVQVTIVKDVDGVTSEESYNPVQMLDITRTLLAGDIQRGMGEDIDPRTAAHELRGFVKALTTMGVVRGDDERFYVALDSFGPPEADIPLTAKAPAAGSPPGEREDFLAYICDELCKYREGRTQEELDAVCAKCKAGKRAGDPPALTPREVQGLRSLQGLLKEVSDYVNGDGAATPESKAAEHSARQLEMKLPEHATLETLQKIINAAPSGKSPRDTFMNLDPSTSSSPLTRKAYALGKLLENNCPENDCCVYLNIFRMAKSLDTTLDGLDASGYPAQVLRRDLRQQLRELWRMYRENHAVQQFKKGVQQ